MWLRATNRFILDEPTWKLVYDFTVTCYVHRTEVILRCHKQEIIFGNLFASSDLATLGLSLLLHETAMLKSLM